MAKTRGMTLAVVGVLAAATLAGPAVADVIQVPHSPDWNSRLNMRNDNGLDDITSVLYSRAGAWVGENYDAATYTPDGECRAWVPFGLTPEQRAAIGLATSIKLYMGYNTMMSAFTDYNVDLWGYQDLQRTVTDASTYASDYSQGATLLVEDYVTPSTTKGGFVIADVTAFAKAEASRSASSTIVFRLQMDPATLPVDNDLSQAYRFFIATDANYPTFLEVDYVPEPASLVVLALGGLLVARRRR